MAFSSINNNGQTPIKINEDVYLKQVFAWEHDSLSRLEDSQQQLWLPPNEEQVAMTVQDGNRIKVGIDMALAVDSCDKVYDDCETRKYGYRCETDDIIWSCLDGCNCSDMQTQANYILEKPDDKKICLTNIGEITEYWNVNLIDKDTVCSGREVGVTELFNHEGPAKMYVSNGADVFLDTCGTGVNNCEVSGPNSDVYAITYPIGNKGHEMIININKN